MRALLLAGLLLGQTSPSPAADKPAAPNPPDATAPDEPPAALVGAAVQATQQNRFCDAVDLFEATHARWPSARWLYNAAEVANAAGDRWRAVELYRDAQRLYPEYERKGVLQKRLDDLGRRIAQEGPGTACTARRNRCGDWWLEGAEACDDGNTQNGDGCDENCRPTGCGNGVLTAGEVCDDGNLVDGDGCDSNCQPTGCGNGVVTPGEQCDDNNNIDGDGCDHNCTVTACGNGVRTAGEQCDDGNQKDGDGCDEGCVVTGCGNGVVTGRERCDDGNGIDGDGCESDCTITRVRAPLPGILVATAGLAAAATAGGLFYAAGYVWSDHALAVDKIAELEGRYENDPDSALATLDEARDREAAARTAWDGWGRAALGGGTILGVGGVAALVGGVWWAVTRTEQLEEAP